MFGTYDSTCYSCFYVQNTRYQFLNKAPETKDMMIFNTENDFADTCTLMNVAKFTNF